METPPADISYMQSSPNIEQSSALLAAVSECRVLCDESGRPL